MTDEELMQEALDALQWSSEYLEGIGAKLFPECKKAQPGSTVWHVRKSIDSLRKRLEQPAQNHELAANNWSVFNAQGEIWSGLSFVDAISELTPKRMKFGWSVVCVINKDNYPSLKAKLKEKNA